MTIDQVLDLLEKRVLDADREAEAGFGRKVYGLVLYWMGTGFLFRGLFGDVAKAAGSDRQCKPGRFEEKVSAMREGR